MSIFSGESSKEWWAAINRSPDKEILYDYGCKAQEMEASHKDLVDFCEKTIGFCVNFRQTEDWENHPDVGVLFALAKTVQAQAQPSKVEK